MSVSSPPTAVKAAVTGLDQMLQPKNGVNQRFIFFGGKGGVGKTSTSASVAVKCADSGLNTLVISTDPAHSLGDALDQAVGGGKPVRVNGIDNLFAMEVDATEAIKDFEKALSAFDVSSMASSLGIGSDVIDGLGLDEFSQILRNPPPGIDELVALAGVVKLARSKEYQFDRVIIDTAPTGHTLRLLSFPDFLDQFLDKVIKLRSRLDSVLGVFKGLFSRKDSLIDKADMAVEALTQYREQMIELRELFTNADATEFCIVTIPTQLAIAESGRLLDSLDTQGISVNNMVVNQLVSPSATGDYLNRVRRGQEACMQRLEAIQGSDAGLKISKVPFFDMEVTGVYPLRYMAEVAYGGENSENWSNLMTDEGQKFVIVGGKGGVGKTSSAAALAVKFADSGYDTVVVSTDPAHSLGDALMVNLKYGKSPPNGSDATSVPRGSGLTAISGVAAGGGRLYALEVDTEGSLNEFKEVVDSFLKKSKSQEDGSTSSSLLGKLNLEDFADVLDNAPPGTDELVALSKVLKLVRGENDEGIKFDRIVIDTAPTGHTLRMLSYPEFLDEFFEKIIKIRGRFKGASKFLSMFSGSSSSSKSKATKSVTGSSSSSSSSGVSSGVADEVGYDDDADTDKDRLRDFQFKMMELQELFRDEEKSEFVVVTIASVLAVAESERLVKQLREQEVPVRHMVVNKLITAETSDGYVQRLTKGQAEGVKQLEQLTTDAGVTLTKVPFFDVEVRGVYGLRAMSTALFPKPAAE